jgi:hypothetical protein
MLISLKMEADFSRGCAGKRIGHSLFATHPYPGSRERLYASTHCVSGNYRSLQLIFTHCFNILCLAISYRARYRPFSTSIGPQLCSIVDMKLREHSF